MDENTCCITFIASIPVQIHSTNILVQLEHSASFRFVSPYKRSIRSCRFGLCSIADGSDRTHDMSHEPWPDDPINRFIFLVKNSLCEPVDRAHSENKFHFHLRKTLRKLKTKLCIMHFGETARKCRGAYARIDRALSWMRNEIEFSASKTQSMLL